VLALTGCAADRGDGEPDLVSGEALVSAFEAAGEDVTLEAGFAKDPGSPIDARYDGAGGSLADAGFGLVLLEDVDAALKHAVSILAVSYGQLNVVRHRNVVLVTPSTMERAREARLVAVLESL
jgi:hypothetical protein